METMGVVGERQKAVKLLNRFSKPESSETAVQMKLNCCMWPYRHCHNPLPKLHHSILEEMKQTNPQRNKCIYISL